MWENMPGWLKGAAGILLTMIIIGVALAFFMKGKNITDIADNSVSDVTTKLTQTQYASYETGKQVSGSEAINAIRSFGSKDFTVTIVTKASSKDYNDPQGYTVTSISDKDYIEPTSMFKCKLDKTSNDTVNHLTLTQK